MTTPRVELILSSLRASLTQASAHAPSNNAFLFCHLSIIMLALILPEGRVGASPRPFSVNDVLIVSCIALFIAALGIFHGKGRAALRLAGIWAVVVLTLILARRVTPMASPVMAVLFMLGVVLYWRKRVTRVPGATPMQVVAALETQAGSPDAMKAKTALSPDREAMAQMVHDLRSPLSAVLALVEKQGMETAGAVQHDFLQSLRKQAQYGLTVAQNFLQLARAERLERSRFLPVSLQDLGYAAADQVQPLADKKAVSIRVEEGGEPLWVSGDYCMLLRAVVNLVENAVKYSPPRTRVTVAVARQGNAARVSVSDQGAGISAQALPRLCQAFYRAEGARKYCPDGVGMGLAIVAAVAKRHGAEVTVRSLPDTGSTFSLMLPLMPEALRDGQVDVAQVEPARSVHAAR